MSRTKRWRCAFLTILLVASGTLSILWQARQHTLLYPNRAFAEAREVRPQLPVDALVLTSIYGVNPIWSLAGQPVVAGRLDYISGYGLSASEVKRDIATMYAGGNDALLLLQKYQVQYVLISHYERSQLRTINEPFFARCFPLIFQKDGVSIYQIRRRA